MLCVTTFRPRQVCPSPSPTCLRPAKTPRSGHLRNNDNSLTLMTPTKTMALIMNLQINQLSVCHHNRTQSQRANQLLHVALAQREHQEVTTCITSITTVTTVVSTMMTTMLMITLTDQLAVGHHVQSQPINFSTLLSSSENTKIGPHRQ